MSKSIYITLALLIGALFATASSVFAIGAYGKKLEIAVDQNGKPKNLSVAYAYDANWGWYLNATTTLKADDIADLPDVLTLRVVDESSGKVYYTNENVSKKVLLNTSVMIKNEGVLREFLPQQKNAAITVSNSNGDSLYFLSVSDACAFSANVNNLSKQGKPACVVDPKDFSNKSDQCEEQKTKLLQYITLGYTTCSAAKEIYAKMGCGELPCSK